MILYITTVVPDRHALQGLPPPPPRPAPAVADTPTAASAVPELYEPVLLGFTVLSFRLRGYESLESEDGRVGVVQEWHCELP